LVEDLSVDVDHDAVAQASIDEDTAAEGAGLGGGVPDMEGSGTAVRVIRSDSSGVAHVDGKACLSTREVFVTMNAGKATRRHHLSVHIGEVQVN
jgi:hypothetical protein